MTYTGKDRATILAEEVATFAKNLRDKYVIGYEEELTVFIDEGRVFVTMKVDGKIQEHLRLHTYPPTWNLSDDRMDDWYRKTCGTVRRMFDRLAVRVVRMWDKIGKPPLAMANDLGVPIARVNQYVQQYKAEDAAILAARRAESNRSNDY